MTSYDSKTRHRSDRDLAIRLSTLLSVTLLATSGAVAGPILVDTSAATAPTDCTLASAVSAAQLGADVAGCTWDGEALVEFVVPAVELAASIAVSSTVVIHGNDAVLSRADNTVAHRFFDVSGSLELKRLTLDGGHKTNGRGGAIKVTSSGSLVATVCTFAGNSAELAGGAIYSLGATTVESSLFTANTAGKQGGAIYAQSGTLQVERSTFADNQATLYGGGAVSARVAVDIENSTFSANTAGWGGALYQGVGEADITLSTFAENASTGTGSANTLAVASSAVARIDRSALQSDAASALCSGPIDSLDWNAASDLSCDLDAAGDQEGVVISLSELVDHGGATPVHVPLCDSWVAGVCQSPLVDRFPCDAFPSSQSPLYDQRNQMPRRVDLPGPNGYPETGPRCDVGAYESGCQTTYWTTPGEDQVVRLHREQTSTSTRLLDSGACYAHQPEFTATSGCSVRWEIYGGLLEVTDIVFVDPQCSYDCFESPDLCALHCAVAAPTGWEPAQTQSSGSFRLDVATCDGPQPLPGEATVPYVVEYVSSADPLNALYWDPRMPVEPPSGP